MASLDPVAAIRAAAIPLGGGRRDYDELLDLVGDARFVLLGEATHGTHEFYEERARITQRLIEEKGFHAVAVEADWPDAYRVNRYVRGQSDDADADAALSGFERFPSWMWRNTDVSAFVDWLREHNAKQAGGKQVGFYGLDLYSLFTSLREVLAYLDKVDPQAAKIARERYACFDHYYEDSQHYGYLANLDLSASCEEGVIEQLNQMGGARGRGRPAGLPVGAAAVPLRGPVVRGLRPDQRRGSTGSAGRRLACADGRPTTTNGGRTSCNDCRRKARRRRTPGLNLPNGWAAPPPAPC